MIPIYKKYKGLWVAIINWETKPKVVASAKTLKTAMDKAQKKGYSIPLMTHIPRKVLPIVGGWRIHT